MKPSISNRLRFLLLNGGIGLALLVIVHLLPAQRRTVYPDECRRAADCMSQALDSLQRYCGSRGINAGIPEDPLQSGLIGPEWSDIATTLGDPAAKRTTLNPAFAALIVSLLDEAGVRKGDTIAIGCSASFPALLIASLSAARAMGLTPRVIFSFGSSSYGATNPGFNLWDLYRLLLDDKLFDVRPVAASIGGENDTGREFDPETVARLKKILEEAAIPLIEEPELRKNVAKRMQVYLGNVALDSIPTKALTGPGSSRIGIKAFINSGGGYANMGTSPMILKIRPGLIRKAPLPDPSQRGMIQEMIGLGVPVIHLLNIRELAMANGLPWDPASRPDYRLWLRPVQRGAGPASILLALAGLAWFILFLLRFRLLNNSR